MESSIAEFLERQPACELLPTTKSCVVSAARRDAARLWREGAGRRVCAETVRYGRIASTGD